MDARILNTTVDIQKVINLRNNSLNEELSWLRT